MFSRAQGNWTVNARAGQGHIVANNSFDDESYTILLYWDSQSTNFGNKCGTDPGETCARCYTLNCDYGCCQAQEKTYIWDNDGRVIECTPTGFDDCLVEDETYFLRPPSIAQDGFQWAPYAYPHPLASAKPASYEARILYPTENLAAGGEEIIRFSTTESERWRPLFFNKPFPGRNDPRLIPTAFLWYIGAIYHTQAELPGDYGAGSSLAMIFIQKGQT